MKIGIPCVQMVFCPIWNMILIAGNCHAFDLCDGFSVLIGQIDKLLCKRGYETAIRKSKFSSSRAKVIVVGNSSPERNITQVQVSPGSKRHGDVPYVKISTNDIGILKIIDARPSQYKSDGKEKATLLFRRYFTWNLHCRCKFEGLFFII